MYQDSSAHGVSIIALTEWLATPPGRYLLAWEQDRFDAMVADIFGFRAAQLGLLALPALRANRMPFLFAAVEPYTLPAAASVGLPLVVTSLDELPFAAQSLDLLVLPHALEFADDPHQVLREVERVLIPEGRVVISGINPHSLWGARQLVGRTLGLPFLPGGAQFLALTRLKDWLKLLSFEIEVHHFGCYRPPLRGEQAMARCAWMEGLGRRWWSIFGAVYMVTAVKRVRGMRLIGPTWREPRVAPSVLRPAANRSGLLPMRPEERTIEPAAAPAPMARRG